MWCGMAARGKHTGRSRGRGDVREPSPRQAGSVTGVLASWNDGAARRTVVEFVERTVSDSVPAQERVAVFDNDGTLWCEKPMPIQADFILRRLLEMAQADPKLRGRQPWKAAYERDYAWLANVLAEHYAGDDSNLPALA